MKNITHVFFDLDHTLWDYETNSRQTLLDLCEEFGIANHVEPERFLALYEKVNEKLWHKFNSGQRDREHIRKYRFPQVLRKLKIYINHKPEDLHEFFVQNCSTKPGLMPHARETLHYLQDRYPLAIITNGFPEAQHPKMNTSGLNEFFEEVFISDLIGWRKPQVEIFRHALKEMNAQASYSVMIGDNPKTDIKGAERAGMKAIFYNPSGRRKSTTEWEVQSLDELIGIL